MSDSYACAEAVLTQLVAQGVRELVLCPGSRSAPLALVAQAADRAGAVRLHVRVDERTAGFLALGLAKAGRGPAAVITTSGTAVANLAPAVLEAHHSAVPLIVVTADRPASLVGFGANQTTEQADLFTGFVRYRARVASSAPAASWQAQAARAAVLAEGALGGDPGPVHLNVELGVPLVPSAGPRAWPAALPAPLVTPGRSIAQPVALPGTPRTVVLAGDASPSVGAAARALAESCGLPLLAEPSSNARSGPNAIRTARLLLGTDLGAAIQRVLVFGRPTLSRPVSALLARPDVEIVVVSDRSDFPDPGWQARLVAPAVTVEPGPAEWLAAWQAADALRQEHVTATLAEVGTLTGPELADRVVASVPSDALLILASSNPIRDADLASIRPDALLSYANRGLSGIDGTISTAIGLCLAGGRPGVLLCGDLAFTHDVGALAIGSDEPRPELRIVVADDAGGSIFATLEYGAPAFAQAFERVFATPTGLDPVTLAGGYGVPARRIDPDDLAAALAAPISGLEVLVVGLDRTGRADLDARLAAGPSAG
ncbi:2-succinyl-5-enolpyruvyl-6-hydroxy-3-cyclohexene-1-carboxylate synthase [Propionicimonas paludicola]|uniref:2-succinyl-5-enolpyruvyl-6-hydroxy-3-cyclohexene-1-carboxylate synthase n=1 Tax=Propionicimonas paludicola TaxID=185243 RepID=A0A2A9CU50_9ACTN|nr:2-succinyl-5-enolpyruvyl-6-hydroxy-3-cyclohexene-1-carboxylic-acid synthase [Propionicimonas paludicola]PFG17079.1 2-succinyl-5-enolpyruvyl-6-hydroxy-3-cyclohexene-1-carboxylate synthase [Propionicimonas paludicola]